MGILAARALWPWPKQAPAFMLAISSGTLGETILWDGCSRMNGFVELLFVKN
jgi:hypothetical protein